MTLKINQDRDTVWHKRRFIEYDGSLKGTVLGPEKTVVTLDVALLLFGLLLLLLA